MEEVVLRDRTDYYGYVAWGEYPHCFAAVLNQEECYRLILAKGGNPDMQESFSFFKIYPNFYKYLPLI